VAQDAMEAICTVERCRARTVHLTWLVQPSVAADLQSDAKYYKDLQSEYNNPYLITRRESLKIIQIIYLPSPRKKIYS